MLRWVLVISGVVIANSIFCQLAGRVACRDEAITPTFSTCHNACVACDLDGLTYDAQNVGFPEAYSYDQSGCFTANGFYLGFVPLTPYLTLEVAMSNDCVGTEPPESRPNQSSIIQIFDPIGDICDVEQDFDRIRRDDEVRTFISCAGAALDNEDHPTFLESGTANVYNNLGPFTVGKTHYFFITHIDEDYRCRYTFRVLAGSTAIPELTDIPLQEPPTDECSGVQRTYRVAEPSPVNQYYFTLNGDTLSLADSVTIAWDTAGTYELCIGADNICSEPVERCYPVTVTDPAAVDTTVYLCPDDCYRLGDGSTACAPGNYVVTELRANCPVEVRTEVIGLVPDTTRLLARICSGDTLHYDNATYAEAGTYRFDLSNQSGCDSLVLLDVIVTTCPLTAEIAGTDIRCYGEEDASFTFSVLSGQPPFSYAYQRLGGGPGGSGTVADRGLPTAVNELPVGTYVIEIVDDFGSVGYLNVALREPSPLSVEFGLPLFAGGFSVDCPGAATGTVAAIAGGGVAPYRYSWLPDGPTNAAGDVRSGLPVGDIAVVVTDANSCAARAIVEVREPEPLRLDYLAFDEACGMPNSGSIEAITPSGGVGPYAVDLVRGDTQLTNFDALSGGTYQLGFTDANGCRATVPVVLTTSTVPTIKITATDDLIYLGDPVQLRLVHQGATTWAWDLPAGSDCPGCTNPSWIPYRTFTARVSAASEDGCVTSDSLRILVVPRYEVFVPTAFSPNGDGTNDRFYPNLGAAAVELTSLSVYDRWGGLVYRTAKQEAAAVPLAGWDGGLSDGRPAPNGVYLWTMEVRFRDGHTERRGGDVMLLR